MTPWPVAVAVIAPFAGRLADRYPAGLLGGIGLAGMTVGLALLTLLPSHPALPAIIAPMALCGLGFGFFNSPNNRAMLTAAPRERSGGASGMLATARLLGQTTGAALVALCFALAHARGPKLALTLATVAALAATIASLSRLSRAANASTAS
jgi:DHA2 family multidrug resistance protein-like MFS transporter